MARIAIDLHGGDFGPSVTLPSAITFFSENPQHSGVLVGDSASAPKQHALPSNVEWVNAMPLGDKASKPSRLLRSEGHSSVEISFQMLQDQAVDSLVSAEHTGVLLALMSKHANLHSLLTRPVLISWLPTYSRSSVMLDLGASFSATSEQLLIYSAIGAGLLRTGGSKPSLSLLNVGTESFKGPVELRNADRVLRSWDSIDYKGFIEASQVFEGQTDVIVCDGFTGNSVIKSAEGALDLTLNSIRQSLQGDWIGRLIGLLVKRRLEQILKPLDPRLANGALLAGGNLLAVKSHGNADIAAFGAAIKRSADMSVNQVIPAIWRELDRLIDDEVLE